jgi:hypothetical protein
MVTYGLRDSDGNSEICSRRMVFATVETMFDHRLLVW